MAKSIHISKRSTSALPDISSYKLEVLATNAENMPDKIFVKQRVRNFARGGSEDFFVAVCTPAQLEDFAEDSPDGTTSFFRTNTIDLVARTAEELQAVFDSLLYETKKLVVDLTDLEKLDVEEIYVVNAEDPITILPGS